MLQREHLLATILGKKDTYNGGTKGRLNSEGVNAKWIPKVAKGQIGKINITKPSKSISRYIYMHICKVFKCFSKIFHKDNGK